MKLCVGNPQWSLDTGDGDDDGKERSRRFEDMEVDSGE